MHGSFVVRWEHVTYGITTAAVNREPAGESSRNLLEVLNGSSLVGEAASVILQTGRGTFRFGILKFEGMNRLEEPSNWTR